MKVIIAGCRHITGCDAETAVATAIHGSGWLNQIKEVVSGAARGVDAAGEWWAKYMAIPCTRFPAVWKAHGKAAGPIRNNQMALYADALIAIWDGKSRGTLNMIEAMRALGKPVYVYRTDDLEIKL